MTAYEDLGQPDVALTLPLQTLEPYEDFDDYLEMVIQFGYREGGQGWTGARDSFAGQGERGP